ncbi:MAG: hypothetical protein AB8G18_06255 [Gammaproteobacteria bacterium]
MSIKKRVSYRLIYRIGALLCLLVSATSHAIFVSPQPMPLDRLIANTEKRIAANGKDPLGYYVLGRLHYLAFINEVSFVRAYRHSNQNSYPAVQSYYLDQAGGYNREQRRKDIAYSLRYLEAQRLVVEKRGFTSLSDAYDSFKPTNQFDVKEQFEKKQAFRQEIQDKSIELETLGWEPPRLSEAELHQHALLARQAFERAIELDHNHALALLGIASLFEQYLDFVGDQPDSNSIKGMDDVFPYKVRQAYFKAHNAAYKKDKAHSNVPMRGMRALVSWEAGKAYERHVRALGTRASPKEELAYVTVRRHLDVLEKIPPARAITPIVFSLTPRANFSELIDNSLNVKFDLSGYGQGSSWPWVKPETAFLVYDQNGDGRIESARDMFGSYTFKIPFANGYQALSLLDNNSDGELAGTELEGISAWFDINSDGVSDPGEVIPIQGFGVLGISTEFSVETTSYLHNPSGLRLKGGQFLATWDWFATPN